MERLFTPKGTPYLSLQDSVLKDPVRAFIPVSLNKKATVVWLIHAFGSSHDALLGGYYGHAIALVDAGYVVICPNLGGSKWTAPVAQDLLKATYKAVETKLKTWDVEIENQILFGTSHGAALATFAAGKRLIPNIRGLYLVNGVYDTESLNNVASVGLWLTVFNASGRSSSVVRMNNPARIPAWQFDCNVRIVFNETFSGDPVPPIHHSVKLLTQLRLVDAPVTAWVHKHGHSTPPGIPSDLIRTVKAWLPDS